MLTFGSLFAGIGGGDLGMERAGLRGLWQIERDKQCNQVLARNWPDVTRFGDIMEVRGEELPQVDLVIGGDPCPCRSRARGIQQSKSPDLFPEFLRIVSAVRPAWVLRENVVAGDTQDCARALVWLGYDLVAANVDSARVTGQSRPRVYLLGVLAGTGRCPVHALSLVQGVGGDSAESAETQAQSPCLSTHPRRWDTRDGYVREPIARTVLATAQRHFGGTYESYPAEPVHPTLMTMPGKGDHNAREAFVSETPAFCVKPQSGMPTPWSTTFVDEQGMRLRILSVIERLRLQGFPDDWLDGFAFTPACRMVGNAMTVPVVEHFGRAIMAEERAVRGGA